VKAILGQGGKKSTEEVNPLNTELHEKTLRMGKSSCAISRSSKVSRRFEELKSGLRQGISYPVKRMGGQEKGGCLLKTGFMECLT